MKNILSIMLMLGLLLVMISVAHSYEYEIVIEDYPGLTIKQVEQVNCLITHHELNEDDEIFDYPDDPYFIQNGIKISFYVDSVCELRIDK